MASQAIDANSDTSRVLDNIISAGYVAIGRYYSSNSAKRLTAAEAAAISAAGLKIFTVFEDSAKPALNYVSGVHDAKIAVQQAEGVKQPAGSVIYFALDSELGNQDLAGVRNYFKGISDTVAGTYKLGIYGDGVICQALLNDGTCSYAWLSASRGFPGSRDFYNSNHWALAQSPDIDQNFHGLSIDVNEINGDFGAFQVAAQLVAALMKPAFHRPMTYVAAGTRRQCVPYFKRGGTRPAARAAAGAGPWTVPDLCKAYDWPTNQPGGGVIAIVELNGGWVPTDMSVYFSSIGQPMPQIRDISVDGGANNPNQHIGELQDPDIEVAMDIQIAAAAYFAATGKPAVINVYWAQGNGIAAAIRKATADGCDVCSISWGSDEANWVRWGHQAGQDMVADMEAAAKAATDAGMVVFAASGDNDSSDGGLTPANVDIPSSCPHVIGCGGTTKTMATEVVWNNDPGQTDGEGTGGGYSTLFLPLPSWQVGAPAPPPGKGRMVPDVAANADPNTGYWMFVHGNKTYQGGTSAVAPLYSGLFAAFGRRLGFITPTLWQQQNQACFNDIVQGENGLYQAQNGPDPCTGLGSPIGSRLAALFGPHTAAVAVKPAALATAGWSGTVTFTYVNGLLVSAPQVMAHGAAPQTVAARAAASSFTVLQGHRYSATITLSGFEALASNDQVAQVFENYGFQQVNVTGAGAERHALGTWTGPDTTVPLDPRLSDITDLGSAAVAA